MLASNRWVGWRGSWWLTQAMAQVFRSVSPLSLRERCAGLLASGHVWIAASRTNAASATSAGAIASGRGSVAGGHGIYRLDGSTRSISCTRLMSTETRDRRVGRQEHRLESRVPDDLVGAIRRARVDRLLQRLVDPRQQDENLGLARAPGPRASAPPAGSRSSIGCTIVHDSGKNVDLVPLERQRRVASHRAAAAVGLERAEQHLRFELDDLVPPPVHDAEHQAVAVVVRRDDGAAAEEQRRRRPREPREEQTGRERLIHQAHERLDGDHDVGRHPVRGDLAVADRGERLDAEEERLAESSAEHRRAGAEQGVGSARQIRHGEHEIQHEIGHDDDAEKARPRDRQQHVVRREALEESQAGPRDVERAVAIEQALPALAADDRAEAEIAIARLLLGRAPRRERAGFEGRLGHGGTRRMIARARGATYAPFTSGGYRGGHGASRTWVDRGGGAVAAGGVPLHGVGRARRDGGVGGRGSRPRRRARSCGS